MAFSLECGSEICGQRDRASDFTVEPEFGRTGVSGTTGSSPPPACRALYRSAAGSSSDARMARPASPSQASSASMSTVGKWRRRFFKDRVEGLLDEARPGRPRTIDDDQVAAVIERTLRSTPKDATHWSNRSMATQSGFSHTTIRRIWNAFGLQPHRSETFSFPATLCWSTRSATSSASAYRRPIGRWC
jgi:hypothetical protein